ncbi:hypothetical protein [Microbacterium sp. TNHR37B]|uniref:hypothetical protein n=1 Tax=Microbacterium sp. TNHR37B TaxID=1775956 RepID=UPI0007B1C6EE|nr:hypothetical protein [Microbacterium sp. TNHR37B]KZE91181.1 hypothetical protein AVP41_00716 [Microbacterium sp. TNHR37B]
MSARSDLAELIAPDAPDTWEIHAHPVNLLPFDDPQTTVAVVIEQRSMTAGNTSPDGNGMPIAVELMLWVVVDGSRGDDTPDVEDLLEDAAATMIRILEPLPTHVWDGAATRDAYDNQKPAYQFTIRASGALTLEESA